jgi:hypothetical protein
LDRGVGSFSGAEPGDCCRRSQEDWRARFPLDDPGNQAYLQDFDRLQKIATSDEELFDQMTKLYPDWVANQSWLMFGFPHAVTPINRVGAPLCTWEEGLAHIQENRIRFQRGE